MGLYAPSGDMVGASQKFQSRRNKKSAVPEGSEAQLRKCSSSRSTMTPHTERHFLFRRGFVVMDHFRLSWVKG